ncbi:MAG: hypothetical protein WBC91_14255 [Phototrophicaceae bacterium]
MATLKEQFTINFADGQFAPAMRIAPKGDPLRIIDVFNLITPRPTIFISGGASAMSDEDIERTRILIDECISVFAEEKKITVIDGGTEAGVMDMIGDSRLNRNYKYPLIGVSPLQKVEWPGFSGSSAEAELQNGHSHFVLVESDEWGGETEMIVALTKAIAARQAPMVGILVNGGKIAEREAYMASAIGENRMPLIIIDGSGRAADNISTAFKTQSTDSYLIRSIIKGADLRLTALYDGKEALRKELDKVFHNWHEKGDVSG